MRALIAWEESAMASVDEAAEKREAGEGSLKTDERDKVGAKMGMLGQRVGRRSRRPLLTGCRAIGQ